MKQEQFEKLEYSDKWTNKKPSMKTLLQFRDTDKDDLTEEEINNFI